MAARTLLPSEYDIQRERDALKDLRRRSANPGALIIDPDLPNQSPPSPPTIYRQPTPSDASFLESASGSGTSSTSESPPATPNNPADDPFHLFWVPASLHPEIAPAEFRAFLKEHARSPPTSEDGSTSSGRSDSLTVGSSRLGRKKSMLSRQYKPDEHDGSENEDVVPLRRNRSSLYTNRGPQLTISDLQKLEQLAEEATTSDDPSQLRNVLRRSLSMNISPSAIRLDELTEMVDEADAPIIVPPPGQILRRTARTKIRKPGLPGDGNGHRFGSSRRGVPSRAATAPIEQRTSSDFSSSDHGESLESSPLGNRPFSDDGLTQRPESYSEETSIFDAYVRSDEESDDPHLPPVVITASPPSVPIELPEVTPLLPSPAPEALLEALGPVIQHPQPQHLLSPQPPAEQQLLGPPSRTPSPAEPTPTPPLPTPATPSPSVERPPLTHAHTSPSRPAATPSPPPVHHRKDKDKKGLFGKWGGDKSGKKAKHKDKDKVQDVEEKDKEKDKDGGFFGSFFGGSKKKQDETPPPLLSPGHAGREAAHAILGASKSKLNAGPVSPGLSAGVGPNNYSRYPIHVERAIYRLSHIKLANPRRPLYEQVLISNLMFWYLGVINKAQAAAQAAPVPVPASQQPKGGVDAQQATENNSISDVEKEQKEQEQQELRERAEKERIEKERADKVVIERQQKEQQREVEIKKKESGSGRKASLTKAPAGGGGRRAEMPVKGPQYEMQHRVMEQEYGGYNNSSGNGGQSQGQQGGASMGRSASAPVVSSGGNGGFPPYHHQHQHQRNPQPPPASQYNTPPKLVQPQPQYPGEHHYYNPDSPQQSQSQAQQSSRLPPGAKPPDQNWHHQPQPPHMPRSHSSPARPTSPGRSKSPPIRNHAHGHGRPHGSSSQDNLVSDSSGVHERLPGRSLSATAVSPQPMANGRVKKGSSAHAVAPSPQPSQVRRPRTSEGRQEQNGVGNLNGEEEDIPLAMWQRQQRR